MAVQTDSALGRTYADHAERGLLAARGAPVTARRARHHLAMDAVQLGLLLTLTGGTGNPFALFVLAPLTIGASVLPRRQLYVLGTATALHGQYEEALKYFNTDALKAVPEMAAIRLLKSCAVPPVSCPSASIFCD